MSSVDTLLSASELEVALISLSTDDTNVQGYRTLPLSSVSELNEKDVSVRDKLSRGKFTAAFLIRALEAAECHNLNLQ